MHPRKHQTGMCGLIRAHVCPFDFCFSALSRMERSGAWLMAVHGIRCTIAMLLRDCSRCFATNMARSFCVCSSSTSEKSTPSCTARPGPSSNTAIQSFQPVKHASDSDHLVLTRDDRFGKKQPQVDSGVGYMAAEHWHADGSSHSPDLEALRQPPAARTMFDASENESSASSSPVASKSHGAH